MPRAHRPLPDYLAPNLGILFVGINPGLRSAALGHHYAGHSNRFWKLLSEARLVPFPLGYEDDRRLPQWGIGLTNLTTRSTAEAKELTEHDYARGRRTLLRNVSRYRSKAVVLLGMGLYAVLFPNEPAAIGRKPGLQPSKLCGSDVILLPNPSGRNAAYPYRAMLEGFLMLSHYLPKPDRAPGEES
ncbi:mismatch-specific DNA-glycosylase [Nitrospirales bacterium NOB]|nr:G/U mismatch-specific DNA glycosylase [Nitrospirota bacterium]MDL1891070.1 mismatch-specific DNA-glycosylase [Nitrospirales bacterium NOB]QOJ35239.1 MAG: mismatch-specific DNA-glycosylase [Nitrospira sp.]